MGKPAGKDAAKNARTTANRERRIAKDAANKSIHSAKRLTVTIKRKRGAVSRLERRIANGGGPRLTLSLVKAQAALKSAEAC